MGVPWLGRTQIGDEPIVAVRVKADHHTDREIPVVVLEPG
jgi:hypothetical protein